MFFLLLLISPDNPMLNGKKGTQIRRFRFNSGKKTQLLIFDYNKYFSLNTEV